MQDSFTAAVSLHIGRIAIGFSIPEVCCRIGQLSRPFHPFRADSFSVSPEVIRVSLVPGTALDSTEGFELMVTTDLQSPVYRRGRTFLLKRTMNNAEGCRWTTHYDTEKNTATSYIPGKSTSHGGLIFPAINEFPHLQFLLTAYLSARRGALHHCAGAIYRGRMFIFPALSGTGKSTLSKLLHASGLFDVASDEVIITRFEGDALNAYGSPWPSSAGFARNISAPLGGMVFLHQAPDNRVEAVTPADAQRRLLANTDIPWYDEIISQGVLDHIHSLVHHVPLRALHFRPDQSAVACLAKSLDQL